MTMPREIRVKIGKRKKEIGALGELLVVKHLCKNGFTHIQSNFLKRQGELDVIMKNDRNHGKIHIIEVKTVSRENMFATDIDVIRETDNYIPEENVSPWKMRKLSRVVEIYLGEKGLGDREWQFDVAVVFLDLKNKKACLKFIKDIPLNARDK